MDLHWGLLLRILVGAALGGIIGYERHIHGRPAGLRTHFIVALASATFMVVSTNFVYLQHYGHDDLVTVDPSRIAASVVTGVGFLGVAPSFEQELMSKGSQPRRDCGWSPPLVSPLGLVCTP